MKREELLKVCHYFKGEEKNPFKGKNQDKMCLWDYERVWVEYAVSKSGRETLVGYVHEFERVGLTNFKVTDNVPITLKALIFNRYAKGDYSMFDAVEPYKKFYQKYYD